MNLQLGRVSKCWICGYDIDAWEIVTLSDCGEPCHDYCVEMTEGTKDDDLGYGI